MRPKIKLKNIPIKILIGLSIADIVFNPKILAPRIAGKDNKNENLKDSSGLVFENRPAEIVMPDRETPGNKANIWANPIINAEKTLTRLLLFLKTMVIISTRPVIPKKILTTVISLKVCSI